LRSRDFGAPTASPGAHIRIDLDPASCEEAQRTVQASEYFTADDDGLGREWFGNIFLNPPYSRELGPKFIDKLVEEFRYGYVAAAIALTNNKRRHKGPKPHEAAISISASSPAFRGLR
jgi:hypothetical protein